MTPVCCPKCGTWLELPQAVPARGEITCLRCATPVEFELFPALQRGLDAGTSGEASLPDEASCFTHGDKRAEAACDQCGRYMCALCCIRVGSRSLCPSCFEGGVRGKSEVKAVRFRVLYAHLGAVVAFASLALGVFAFLGAPFAIGLALFGFFKRTSLTGRRPFLATGIAVVLGVLEGLLFFALFRSPMRFF